MKLSSTEGTALVRYARSVISSHYSRKTPPAPESLKEFFNEDRGVFVTLETYPEKELRGCIGYPEPIMPLGDAVKDAAVSAATRDPRFPPVRESELDNLIVEVSVLTKPELIKVKKPMEYAKEVVVGRDGLIVEKGYFRGLLLPQVPVEWKWDAEEFLSNTCMKAGLNPDAWLLHATKIYKFSAQIFSETSPAGEVVEKKLS